MKKKSSQSPFSLFSFQDIITAITGIMFLIVLMLVLLVLENPDSTQAEAIADQAAREKLQQSLQTLQRSLSAQEDMQQDLEARLAEWQKLNLERIEKDIHAALGSIRLARNEDAQRVWQMQQSQTAWEILQLDAAEASQALLQAENMRQQLLAKQQMMLEELKIAQKKARLIPYSVDRSFTGDPIVAECTAKRIRLIEPGKGTVLHNFQAVDQETAIALFLQWLEKQKPTQIYLCLLLQPAAFPYAELLRQKIKERGFRRGMELLPTNDSFLVEEQE